MVPTASSSVFVVSSGCDEDAIQDNNHALVPYGCSSSAQSLEILAPVTARPNFDHLDRLTKIPSLPNLDVESSSTTHSTPMGTELTITTVALRDPSPRISSARLTVTTVAITSNVVVPSRFTAPIVAAQSYEHSLIALPIRNRSLVLSARDDPSLSLSNHASPTMAGTTDATVQGSTARSSDRFLAMPFARRNRALYLHHPVKVPPR
ncbi:hypothetical protein BT96DRAFT_493990 [Gymnopus androsaceus JB14]|uniref:Uncharacterized protein n=1 Tax=Gymnopus androsaceus JB14 TaxID=1447944 RepID=A0A6A4I344_9AGAR|nr:hypothetical protein BT96DRAFT_493990 [Gymnopus androsaceus JB14]